MALPRAQEAPRHSWAFRRRRFANWFPLGLTYATFYMGRYNLYNANPELCKQFNWSNEQIGWIITAGFWTYALSLLFNGPLTDKIGGKRAMLIGAAGTLAMNLAIGLMLGLSGWPFKVLITMAMLFAVNSYFQSFGAISIVKVNAHWFHVRERGVFGAIFGAMIQGGYYLAYGVGGFILVHLPLQYVFLIPSAAIGLMALIDIFALKDTPQQAGFPELETHDASFGDDAPVDWAFIVKKIFTNPILITIALAEFCTGFVRSGVLAWWTKYLDNVFQVGKDTAIFRFVSTGIPLAGIAGGFLSGFLSDKVFGSRRPPVAFLFYCGQVVFLFVLAHAGHPWAAAALIVTVNFFINGVHGILSGTSSMDFGGRKGAASATGMLDGCQYLAAGFVGFAMGRLLDTLGWGAWAYSIMGFAVIGAFLMTRLWRAVPSSAIKG